MSRARVADIITLASQMAAIDRKVLVGRSRFRRIVRVRQACMLLARENGHSFPTIGRMFDRDHSTVVHGCEVAEDCVQRDPAYAAFVDRLRTSAANARPYIAERLSTPVVVLPKPKPTRVKAKPKPKVAPIDGEIRKQAEDDAAMRNGSMALQRAVTALLRARESGRGQMRAAG
jgi:hypothetical protein